VSAAAAFARAEAAAQAATDALPNLAPGPQSLGSRCGYPERRQAASIMTRKRQHRTAKLLLDKWRPETPRFNDIVLEQSV
jgi:flavin-dependent dehydrogenase